MKALNTTSQQQGIALITALIITSIAISLAAAVMYRQQIHIRFSGNIAHMEQAYLYANGMEDWAGTFLKKSFKKHPAYDSLKDDWAVLLPPIPIPGGVMNGQLFDLQARINLNSLKRKPINIQQQNNNNQNNNQTNNRGTNRSPNNPNRQPNPNQRQNQPQTIDIAKITRDRITSLIRKTVDPDEDMGPAENFSDIVKDWIDKDQTNGNLTPKGAGSGFGAESPFYQSLAKPYFSADTSLVSPTELRLLKDMNKKVYKKLLDDQLITTLPIKLKTPINVNTANEAVLKAIGFDDQTVTNIIKEREIEPFKNLQAFLNYPDVQYALSPSQLTGHLNKEDIDVKSSFFLLQGMVRINHARLFVNSLLQRKNGKVSVIMRDYSNPQVIK
jgi:general secretion pathway protein K